MYVANVTDYDIMTDDYNESLSRNINCLKKENIFDIIISSLILSKP